MGIGKAYCRVRLALTVVAACAVAQLGAAQSLPAREPSPAASRTEREEKSATKRPSARERAAVRREAREKELNSKKSEQREKWLAKLQARDVEAWPEAESEEEHAAALKKSREMVDEVLELFPDARLHETEFFLFTTNIPEEQVAPYIAALDRMYEWMCRMYGVRAGHQVWLGGKTPIFAFLEHAQFDAFEERYFPEAREQLKQLRNVYGLCHLGPKGDVVIACFRGDDPHNFGQMLVHETSHGFIFRYQTKAQLPNWVDEGMADLIGAEMVPTSRAVPNRERTAIQQLAQTRSLSGMLSAERIQGTQYGMASSLNRFLLQADRNGYVRFIESLKEGMSWEEAIREAYRSTPEEMLAHYGRWIGVAGLQP